MSLSYLSIGNYLLLETIFISQEIFGLLLGICHLGLTDRSLDHRIVLPTIQLDWVFRSIVMIFVFFLKEWFCYSLKSLIIMKFILTN